MAQLTFDISPDEQRELESLAAHQGLSLRDFILAKTLGAQDGDAEDETARILANPTMTCRLEEAMAREAADRVAFDSTGDAKRALGIRAIASK